MSRVGQVEPLRPARGATCGLPTSAIVGQGTDFPPSAAESRPRRYPVKGAGSKVHRNLASALDRNSPVFG